MGALISFLFPMIIIGGIIYYFISKENNNINNKNMAGETLIKFKKVGLAVSIIIVLNILIWTAIETFYKNPKYEDFCPQKQVETQITNQDACVNAGGQWVEGRAGDVMKEGSMGEVPVVINEVKDYCNKDYTCAKNYEDAYDVYNRNVFIIRAIAGFIVLAVGLAITSVAAVANGLLYGGILSIIIGTTGYWGAMDEYLRFAIMLPTFILLIYLGYRKLRD